MKRTLRTACLLTVTAGVVIVLSGMAGEPRSTKARAEKAAGAKIKYHSPIALVAGKAGKTLYVVENTNCQIAVVDVATGKVRQKLPTPGEATGVALSPDGSELYVTAGLPDGKLVTFDTATGKQIAVIDAGHSPIAPVVTKDGTRYVCDRFRNVVLGFAKGSSKAISIPVSREPVGLGLGDGGKTLVVANHLPAGRADQDFTASVISLIDTGANKVVKSIPLPNGSTGVRDIAMSPDGKLACVTHILARYHLPTTQVERGWMNTNALTIIDVPKKEIINTVLLDELDNGAANAWGAAWTADGKFICVSQAGTHDVSVIDWDGLSKKLDASAKAGKGEEVKNDLSFLIGLRRRIKLEGNGPRGLATIGSNVYAAMYFSDSLCTLDVDPAVRPVPKTIALGPTQPLTKVRKGEMYFNDAMLCFQQWQACASCHPDARTDGLSWDLLSDGMGNRKNVKSMLFSHKTPPTMVTGIRPDAEIAVRAAARFILFKAWSEEGSKCVDEYLKSLRPAPSPYLVKQANGTFGLSASAKRGKVLFDAADCGTCHNGPYLTDMKKYDVGTGTGSEEGLKFDMPTLREVWRSGPYLYNGRAATMEEVFTKFDPKDQHGTTGKLNAAQIKDLCEYVLSL